MLPGLDDTIVLNPGTYFAHGLMPTGKNINLRANTSFGGKPANTIIDAESMERFIYMTDGHSLTIDNLTLAEREYCRRRGDDRLQRPRHHLVHNNLQRSRCRCDGGAIWTNPGTVTIIASTISHCSVTGYNVGNTGRYSVGGAIFNNFGTYTISSSTIADCSAAGTGGAIHSSYGTFTLTSSIISDCSAAESGGAINNDGSGTLTVTDTTITGCSATYGGAIYNPGTVTITSAPHSSRVRQPMAARSIMATWSLNADAGILTITTSTSLRLHGKPGQWWSDLLQIAPSPSPHPRSPTVQQPRVAARSITSSAAPPSTATTITGCSATFGGGIASISSNPPPHHHHLPSNHL